MMVPAIQEGFILDVLRYYTPVNSYYRLVKTVEADPEFDSKRAQRRSCAASPPTSPCAMRRAPSTAILTCEAGANLTLSRL